MKLGQFKIRFRSLFVQRERKRMLIVYSCCWQRSWNGTKYPTRTSPELESLLFIRIILLILPIYLVHPNLMCERQLLLLILWFTILLWTKYFQYFEYNQRLSWPFSRSQSATCRNLINVGYLTFGWATICVCETLHLIWVIDTIKDNAPNRLIQVLAEARLHMSFWFG